MGWLCEKLKTLEAKTVPFPDQAIRRLKIEADGDSWNGVIKPKIRLVGLGLERAGFTPGSHVLVECIAPGLIELRSSVPS
jgi:hypothetical protein